MYQQSYLNDYFSQLIFVFFLKLLKILFLEFRDSDIVFREFFCGKNIFKQTLIKL